MTIQSEETDEEVREMRKRMTNRRHNSATDLAKKEVKLKLDKVGPDQLQERSFAV